MSKPLRKITIRDVAERAGVSTMTVSRAMRADSQVSKETRELVRRVIDELDYEPLQSARSLSSTVARVVGLVVPHTRSNMLARAGYEYLAALHLGAMRACDQHDYSLMVMQIDEPDSVSRLIRRAQARNVGGYVIAAPASEHPGLVSGLSEAGIVHTAINPLSPEAPAMQVRANEREAARALTAHLIEQGHRAIAFVGCKETIRAEQERLAGYKDALTKARIRPRRDFVLTAGASFEDGKRAGKAIIQMEERPTAVQCITDDLAAGVIAAAHEMGLRLPQDLSVSGFDDFGTAQKVWPLLTTAHLPVEEMAAYAAEQVIGALAGRLVLNKSFACAIQIRDSVARPA